MFDAGILSFCVLSDENGVNVIIRSLVTGNGDAGSDIGEKIESTSKSQIE
jgi:hypothetical protein